MSAIRAGGWSVFESAELLFYLTPAAPADAGSKRDPRRIYSLRLPEPGKTVDFATSRLVTAADLGSPLSLIGVAGTGSRTHLLVEVDGRILQVALSDGSVAPFTTDTVSDFVFDATGGLIAYVTPSPGTEDRWCIKVARAHTRASLRTICDPLPGFALRPWNMVLSPDGKRVAIPVTELATGTVTNAVEIVLTPGGPPPRLVFPHDSSRPSTNLYGWSAEGGIQYWKQQDGRWQIMERRDTSGDAVADTSRMVINISERRIRVETRAAADSAGTTITFRDAVNGAVVGTWETAALLELRPYGHAGTGDGRAGTGGGRFLAVFRTASQLPWVDELTVEWTNGGPAVRLRPLVRHAGPAQEVLDRCSISRVVFPTWDVDERTERKRTLTGYLYTPRDLPPADGQIAVIQTYYGGRHGTDPRALIHCALGVTYFSPAIREVRTWEALPASAIEDPGIGEIRDLLRAARVLEQRLGLRPEQIGLWGGSHGGGVGVLALTLLREGVGLPDEESYRFAFGIVQSPGDKEGVLDPRHRHYRRDSTYYAKVMGDTAALRARLPFTRMDLLQAPLLVQQGTEDPTVPIEATRLHVRAAQQRGLPVQLIEYVGEGHNFGSFDTFVAAYRDQFRFMERVTAAARRP